MKRKKIAIFREDSPEERKILGERIKEQLKLHGLSQIEFLNEFETNANGQNELMDVSAFSRCLSGKRKIQDNELRKIAKKLNVPYQYLLGEYSTPTQEADELEAIETLVKVEPLTIYQANEGIISYLESIGYEVNVLPVSGNTEKIFYNFYVNDKDGNEVFRSDEREWNIFKKRLMLRVQDLFLQ
jgi:transcriptional regulator with XRE-family HTH domain